MCKGASCGAVRMPRDLVAFRAAVSIMVAALVIWKLVETWNEWGEGTSVEPGDQSSRPRKVAPGSIQKERHSRTTTSRSFKNSYLHSNMAPPFQDCRSASVNLAQTPDPQSTAQLLRWCFTLH